METKLNFNSQICTTREQSERLLSLGLKRETADMHYSIDHRGNVRQLWLLAYGDLHEDVQAHSLHAWSLHRLIEIRDEICETPLEWGKKKRRFYEKYPCKTNLIRIK